MLELKVFFGGQEQLSKVFSAQQLPVRVGRAPESEVCIDNAMISRRHAIIGMLGSKIVIADQDSDNGFGVGDQSACRVAMLADGDVIRLGKYEVRVGLQQVKQLEDGEKRLKALSAGGALDQTLKLRRLEDAGGEAAHKLQLLKPTSRLLPLLAWHTWIGRAGSCDIVVRGFGIAPRHLLIYWDGESHHACDLTGKGKVKVRDARIDDVVLSPGDRVTLGALQMEYR